MFFNPAGLSLLTSPQATVAAHAINLETKFHDRGSSLPLAGLGQLPAGKTSNDAGDLIPLGNLYLALPLNEKLVFGLAINTPFGLKTDYDDPWIGRFQGIEGELRTINVNPALSWKLNETVAIGVGANFQRADATLTNAVMLGPATEGRASIDVDDNAWGWNAGVLFTLPSATRIGASYRSELKYGLDGDTTVTTLSGLPIAAASGPTRVDVTFPDSAEISIAQPLNDKIEIRGDVMWMNWSKVATLAATNTTNGVPRDILHFGFEDTYRVALGADYKLNEQWKLRVGTAWDESPVKDAVRTVRLARQRSLLGNTRRALATDRPGHPRCRIRAPVRERHGHLDRASAARRPRLVCQHGRGLVRQLGGHREPAAHLGIPLMSRRGAR